MKKKNQQVREYIIAQLEKGKLKSGMKLPGTREIAKQQDVSFLVAQAAIATLVEDNLLYSEGRRGTFVQENWRDQIINNNLITRYGEFPWFKSFSTILKHRNPDFLASKVFTRGPFEIRNALLTQAHQRDYMDLAPLLEQAKVKSRDAILAASAPFTNETGTYGLAVAHSPRVLFFNRSVFRRLGIKIPESAWYWEEFLDCVQYLKDTLGADSTFHWSAGTNHWMNVVLRSGGKILEHSKTDPVRLDSKESRRGIRLWRELLDILGIPVPVDYDFPIFREKFMAGQAAMFFGSRFNQTWFGLHDFNDWDVREMPIISEDHRLSTQACETLCIRKGCTEETAIQLIETIFSTKMQNFLGSIPVGIPVQPKAAETSLTTGDPRQELFRDQLTRVSGDYLDGYPELLPVIEKAMDYLWRSDEDVDELLGEISAMLRGMLKFSVTQSL